MATLMRTIKKVFLDLEKLPTRLRIARNKGHFSNFGEQEIISKYISTLQIAIEDSTVVDIGAGNGIRKSNTYSLVEKGWHVIGIEYDSRNTALLASSYKCNPKAFACRFDVTPLNIVSLLHAFSVEKDFGILSLDIDGYDYWVLDAILSEFRPRLVVSEYNEKIPPPIKFTVNYEPDFTLRHHFFGFSISKLKDLLAKHNYVLLEVEFNNVFLAPAELPGVVPASIEQAYKEGYLNRIDRKEKFKQNENMEILHSLSPEKCVSFLDDFYAQYKGEYQIGLE